MNTDYTPLVNVPIKREDIETCRFSNWYPLFKKHCPTAEIIGPLPAEFIEYLEQDGIKIPNENRSFYSEDLTINDDNEYSDWDNEDDDEEEDKVIQQEVKKEIDPLADFPELHRQIKDVITKYGAVAPKMNWSAPKDATWILPNNTMKCNEINEVYLLLNASNYIAHDLQHAFDECEDIEDQKKSSDFELVLRKWFDINPALEFRIFIKDNEILGISQRDLNYYDYLEPLVDKFRDLIEDFIDDEILDRFPLKSFVIDLYIPRPFNKVFLIDINPFARMTDPLMFSWSELLTKNEPVTPIGQEEDYEFRLIKENNVGRFACKEHSENQVPTDIVEASLNPEAIRELTQKWKELLSKQSMEEDSSSDSNEE
ncbi:hypothetical protein Kpol_1019p20 [Vanderwaltozyma polyspora DSM 70294]|uniref:Translation initiation factor eIF2 assembly protein n=1 Tax=Vanderwaltozyma polyspora (strain ATCC 22028 / DSM 70294 / BCRC 21397 / CBS 2163 / NBRC 10782 / NRRL Y-8283 / UCD 57-17) TaxID=436907 RepID=CD123_VANPO|nr:uncharacterized protein Kpol_1019p20 [Vanderwaltozyma polyspora DSM 70294]A7TPB3.1 RecName: Full=Translation initiation factor eIF2 assembly protein; AltName: Full=Cell division cycle protein 123 [Vanderwaltozyma polyspora DSM 70294]EDO15900.1 hypothetical protein Kpol_1019p20 [Vanderwaltozyma polyspora DSM 70294]